MQFHRVSKKTKQNKVSVNRTDYLKYLVMFYVLFPRKEKLYEDQVCKLDFSVIVIYFPGIC